MLPDTIQSVIVPPEVEPVARRRPWRLLAIPAVMFVMAAILWASGFRPEMLWSKRGPSLTTVLVDKGDVLGLVVEGGALESANNTTVKCQVEALIGLTSGTTGAGGRGAASGTSTGGGGSSSTTATGSGSASTTTTTTSTTSSTGAPTTGSGSSGTPTPGASGSAATTKGASTSGGASATGASATGGASAGAGSGTTQRPEILSFTYVVTPHAPLRPKTTTAAQPKAAAAAPAPTTGGGGGGGGRGGAQQTAERPGSTRILSILPEGVRVKGGEVVCELDGSKFRDEVRAQRIRVAQAKAWATQAASILEVSQISLAEYRDGIYPQDREKIEQYITVCETNLEQARENLDWSRRMAQKNFQTEAQLKAAELATQRSEIVLREARGMRQRLEQYTAPRLIQNLEAKVEAVRADLLAQEASYQLESTRLKRLETMVANCTMRAPRDGIVVYANEVNRRGTVEDQIREGLTVHEGQPIFNLPDPSRMRVRARINESKVASVRAGQPAEVRVDAFPDHPLGGVVAEVTTIPAPANGPISDVKVYYALVNLDPGGDKELRPGLSAQVTLSLEPRRDVTRIPLRAVRWAGPNAFAARATSTGYQWCPLGLGEMDASNAEVISGLEPGDRVVSDPSALPAPPAIVAAKPAAKAKG